MSQQKQMTVSDIEEAKMLLDRIEKLKNFKERSLYVEPRNDEAISARLVRVDVSKDIAARVRADRIMHVSELPSTIEERMYGAMYHAAREFIDKAIKELADKLTALGVDTDGI